ncbi:MAG: efflux RND transporter permease subunit [Bdellovibrionaceae bacterium]|nr:efflux RND transporter permease subunit [Pseudobdellovibrionaceae bacterium]
MSPARLSVRQPVLIASLVTLLIVLGMLALRGMPIDLFPDVTFPTIIVQTSYPGAGPQEVETEITKVIEDQVSSISGVLKVSSQNLEGVSLVIVEFNLNVDLNFAEQEVRAKVTNALGLLPDDVDVPTVQKIGAADAPILGIALQSTMGPAELYDLADDVISPQFEQVFQVGRVTILGGRKREIHVSLDREKLIATDIPATAVDTALRSGGRNIPAGKIEGTQREYSYRTLAEYKKIEDIENTVLRVADVSQPLTIGRLGKVKDTLQDEVSRTRLNGQTALLFNVFRQSGANSVRVADQVKARVDKINADLKAKGISASLKVVNDMSRVIRANVFDVYESIFFGVLLTVIVVYFFLGSLKSTLITGFALPNSILGAFIFMSYFGFSVNIMSLLALSLVVGLLVDDAIVVRENIFRKLEAGLSPKKAAVEGTDQVTLAVIATTATILAVFGPIGNLEGIVGQFFKQFGLTVCFAMLVSLFDGLFVAPAMSAYLGGGGHSDEDPRSRFGRFNKMILKKFDRFQAWLERVYVWILKWCLHHPLKTLGGAVATFFASIMLAGFVPFTFLPPPDNGEFFIQFELPVGASLDATDEVGTEIEGKLRELPQLEDLLTTIGSNNGESNKGTIYVRLVPSKQRSENTTKVKELVREKLKAHVEAHRLIVTDEGGAGGERQFNLNIVGQNMDEVIPYSEKVLEHLKKMSALLQPDSSYRAGKPEYQLILKPDIAAASGVTVTTMGMELRTLIEGQTPAVFRQGGIDYDVRVRLQEDQRNLHKDFDKMRVPNIQQRLVPLRNVAILKEAQGPSVILRESRARYIRLSADVAPDGGGMGGAIQELNKEFESGSLKPPAGISYSFAGEAERFAELMTNMMISLGLGVMFIYLVLASLYGSFIAPFTIMLVIPLALCGAFVSLFVTRSSFDLFSMIGCVMLLGLATKNSILLVDYAMEMQREGVDRVKAMLMAGETRLRPILMTSLALIAGMIPVAIGLNEASKQRTSLGIVVIGGTISSTILTLVVIPAAHMYLDRFQDWLGGKYWKFFGKDDSKV